MKKSSPHKLRFLLDANLSRLLIADLSGQFPFDVIHASEASRRSMTDEEIVEFAKKEKRIIVTHDLDYGEIYYLKERGNIGVIMLRLKDQTTPRVLQRLTRFFSSTRFQSVDLTKNLVILTEDCVRIFTP